MRTFLTVIFIAIGVFGLFAISKFTERFKEKGMLLWQFSTKPLQSNQRSEERPVIFTAIGCASDDK